MIVWLINKVEYTVLVETLGKEPTGFGEKDAATERAKLVADGWTLGASYRTTDNAALFETYHRPARKEAGWPREWLE